MYNTFFRPTEPGSAAADFIPFYKDGVFHLFYLFDHRNNAKFGEGVTWYKIETTDFVNFVDKGEMVARGKAEELDPFAFTGSVIESGGRFHMFYTGHNTTIKTYGYQNECIMHAVSGDCDHWEKVPEDTFCAPDGYDRCDFRDPFVYQDEETGVFYMLLCARPVDGNKLRKGQTIRMKSADLAKWDFDRIIYAPNAFHTHECPDLFKMGDKWYLVFSEYSDRSVTCYRMADSPEGPWVKPANDTFDGRAYYAAKTASDGHDRYLFGWIPTRWGNKDSGFWMWGGNLAVHKLVQNADGTLSVTVPESVAAAFGERTPLPEQTVCADNRCEVVPLTDDAPDSYRLSFDVAAECDRFGVLLHRNAEEDNAYEMRFDLSGRKLSVNRFPCFPQNEFGTYCLHRPLTGNIFHIDILVDDDIAIVYVNGSTALSVRLCNKFGRQTALYVSDGQAMFSDIGLYR